MIDDVRSQVSESAYEMFGICDLDRKYTVWETKDSNPTCLNRDEQDVKLIMDQLNHFDAFKQVCPELINLTTMDVASDDIVTALLSALVQGKEHINGFVYNRLMQKPAKFHNSIKQNSSCAFSSIYEVALQQLLGKRPRKLRLEDNFFKDC